MKRAFLVLAAFLALVSFASWLVTGAHPGWTRTTVMMKTVDEVTGIEAVTYEKQFVMGLELLGGGLAAAMTLAGVAFLFRNKKTVTTAP